MKPLTNDEKRTLDAHFDAIENSVLTDARMLADSGGGMGVFVIAATIIDALAVAYAGNADGKAAWDKFIDAHVPDRDYLHYGRFRSELVHNLSAGREFVFTSGAHDAPQHGSRAGEFVYLHAHGLIRDVEHSRSTFRNKAMSAPDVGRRALEWFEDKPPIRGAPLAFPDAPSASVADGITVLKLHTDIS